MNRHAYNEVFRPDSGLLLDIKIFNTTEEDWRTLLHYLSTKYVTVYSEDGVAKPQPEFKAIWQARNKKALAIEILLPGFAVSSNFFETEQIEMDLRPEDVDSAEKANAVFGFQSQVPFCSVPARLL